MHREQLIRIVAQELERRAEASDGADVARTLTMAGELLWSLVDEPEAVTRGAAPFRLDPVDVQGALRDADLLDATESAEIRRAATGFSKHTVIVRITAGARAVRRVVIRRDLAAGSTPTTVVDEYPLLRYLHGKGFLVPEPFHLERERTVLGQPFMVLEAMHGARDIEEENLAPATRTSILQELATEVARLHQLPVTEVPVHRFASASTNAPEEIHGYVSTWQRIWNRVRVPDAPAIDDAFAWLICNVPHSDAPLGLVHGDLGLHNLLVRNGRVGALLDWEFAHIGEPAEDIAYFESYLEGEHPWADFMECYRAAGGPLVPTGRQQFYRVWRGVRNAVCCALGREALIKALNEDFRLAFAGYVLFRRFENDVAAQLGRVEHEP